MDIFIIKYPAKVNMPWENKEPRFIYQVNNDCEYPKKECSMYVCLIQNIPAEQFILDLTDKIIDFIKRIPWKLFFFPNP